MQYDILHTVCYKYFSVWCLTKRPQTVVNWNENKNRERKPQTRFTVLLLLVLKWAKWDFDIQLLNFILWKMNNSVFVLGQFVNKEKLKLYKI